MLQHPIFLKSSAFLFAIAVGWGNVQPVLAMPVRSANQAIQIVGKQVSLDKIYARPDCLIFMEEESKPTFYGIVVRAKQGGKCPGDPAIAPLIDRFRVNVDGSIFWHDPVNDAYMPYEQFKQQENRR